MLKHCCSEKGREDSSTMPGNTKMLFGGRKKKLLSDEGKEWKSRCHWMDIL